MTEWGGMGGIAGGRPFNNEDRFEVDVQRLLGDKLKASVPFREQMWSALANVLWTNTDGDTAQWSFRAAGDMIAAIAGDGTDYMDYYCSGPYAVVSDEIAEAMKIAGWTADTVGWDK